MSLPKKGAYNHFVEVKTFQAITQAPPSRASRCESGAARTWMGSSQYFGNGPYMANVPLRVFATRFAVALTSHSRRPLTPLLIRNGECSRELKDAAFNRQPLKKSERRASIPGTPVCDRRASRLSAFATATNVIQRTCYPVRIPHSRSASILLCSRSRLLASELGQADSGGFVFL
jgi:hypothetical protein